jgi:MFS transporter, YQGE family, putative transporter
MNRMRREIEVFTGCPRSMQVLMVSNMIYALVLPVIEVFVASYVMRNSNAVDRVVGYFVALYAATPVAFYLNGILIGRVQAKHLYAAGMVLSGASILFLMQLGELTLTGIVVSGLGMGLSTGLFWANRGFLALTATNNSNRNYYYGVELFALTLSGVAMPALIGWFISGATRYGWMGGIPNRAYRIVAVVAFALTVVAAWLLEQGNFDTGEHDRFIFFPRHPLWKKMLRLAFLKGLPQGYIITAPAMLIMLLVGQEGTLGVTQAAGGLIAACVLYTVGRSTGPEHRNRTLLTAVLLFFVGAVVNGALFNAAGVLIFMACFLLAKPLLDLAYNPIEWRVVDLLSRLERRNRYGYLFNHEFGLLTGRCVGCVLFLVIVHWGSAVAALKYTLPVIALLQLLSIPVAGQIARELRLAGGEDLAAQPMAPLTG